MECRHLIGRPYVPPFGCFRLVREILIEHGVEIPNYADSIPEERKAAALLELLQHHADEVDDPQELDVVLLQWAGHPAHIGVVVAPGQMIHSLEQIGAHLERFDRPRWRRRVLGFWRPRR